MYNILCKKENRKAGCVVAEKTNSLAPFLFHQGTNYQAYEYMGAHLTGDEIVFRVWAPHAKTVFLIGDFNAWREETPMKRVSDGGIFEVSVARERFAAGKLYKYRIMTDHGFFDKADPYGFSMEPPPQTASAICDLSCYQWRDGGWMKNRAETMGKAYYEQPLNIYEVHLGSWKRHDDSSYLSYRELADDLIPYVKQMGYTHIELMPVMEHPFDGSWGYQICGYYAPTARFGTPIDFMAFVDSFHEAGIGVILDWVPAHFPKDAHGLYEFDGEPLYEFQGEDRMEHREWGTRCFDVGRNEVECFLVSNASFWAEVYHIDGLRVDAVASMLYLDYDRKPGEWNPNIYGENKSLEAIAFFRKLNSHMRNRFPDVLMIAEESTAWENVTRFEKGGLGFSLKWNMGWMNDILSYLATDPLFRKYHHEKTTFSLTYCFGESYVLPISHDETVHGKKSLLDRMPGDYHQKFAGTRAFLAYMMTHPGKKLIFMGCEIGQFREWDFEGQIEWFLLRYDAHASLQLYFAELNHFYLAHPALYEVDGSWDGFRWIDPDDRDRSILSYRRIDKRGEELIVLVNFTPVTRLGYQLAMPFAGEYEELLNSDDTRYGGSGILNSGKLITEEDGVLSVTVPPLGACIFRCVKKMPKKIRKVKDTEVQRKNVSDEKSYS